MALVDPDAFGGRETACVYVAARLPEAREVERVLSEQQVDYVVETERIVERLLGVIPREYDGVAFHVLADQAPASRRILRDAGLHSGLVDEI